MAAEKTPDKQAMNVNANGDVTMKGVALGNDNQIVTDVKAAGHVVQAGKYANVQIIDGGYYDVKVYTLPADREDTRSWKQRREALRQVTDEPYKFLRYYETSDADLFFGRDAIADRIIEKLFPYKLVLMNGKSGSGKTSLINAGLLPRLMDRGYLTFVFRDYGSPAGDEDCGSPTDLLKNAIMGLKELDLDLSDCPDFACVLRRAATEMKRPIAVFLDQFERFFLNLPEKARRQFVHEIKACFDTFTGEELDLVISIREEFYGQLGEFWELIPEFHTQSFPVYLKPLNPEEAKEAILGPLGKVSTKIDYDPDFLEKVLLPALMRSEEKNSSGSEQVEPTHLQIVCNTLYDSVKTREKERIERGRVVMIGRELYDDLGGVKGILANYLTDKIKQYGGVEEKAKRMLKQMIVPGREESLRGFVTVEQLHERLTGAITREEVEKLVEKLVDDRLVEKKELEGEAMYSLTHEYMANMVNSWYDVDELELQRAREFFKRSLSDWKLSRSLIPRKRFKEIKKFKKQLELEAVGQKLFRLSSIKYSAVSCVIVLLILALGAVFMNQSYHKLYLIPQDIGRLRVETAQGTDLPATHVKIFRITGNGEQESVYNGKEIPFTAKLPKGLYYIEVPRGKYLVRSPAKIGGYPNYASPVLLRIPLEKLSDDIIKDMVFVPEGRFLAGEDPSDQEHVDERTVMLESFYLDTYEVSNGEYRQFLAYMDQNPSSRFMLYSDEPKHKRAKGGHIPKDWEQEHYKKWSPGDRDPVVNVDWYDAYAYCAWQGKRLPTALEWEKAAGWQADTQDKSTYPWGDRFYKENANTVETWDGGQWNHRRTKEVDEYEEGKSFYGVYNMAGNALEWTNSWYEPPLALKKQDNLLNLFELDKQTLQGGSFAQERFAARTYHYFLTFLSSHDFHYGFRCAISALEK